MNSAFSVRSRTYGQRAYGGLITALTRYGSCTLISLALMGCAPIESSPSSPYGDPFVHDQLSHGASQSGDLGQSGANRQVSQGGSGPTTVRNQRYQKLVDPWPASAPGKDQGPQIRRGSGMVRVGVLSQDGVARGLDQLPDTLPKSLIEEFTRRSGFNVHLSTITQDSGPLKVKNLDVLMGLDGADLATFAHDVVPGDSSDVVTYGRDDVCVAIERQWFGANKLDPPNSFDFIEAQSHPQEVDVPDPKISPAGRSFILATKKTYGDKANDWWHSLISKGARVTDPREVGQPWMIRNDKDLKVAQGGSSQSKHPSEHVHGYRPITVTYASRVTANLTNTDSESRVGLVGSTCARRELYAVIPRGASQQLASDGSVQGASSDEQGNGAAQAWLAFVQGAMFQRMMAVEGLAWPVMSDALAENTAMSWFAQPSPQAIALTAGEWGHAPGAVEEWGKAVKGAQK